MPIAVTRGRPRPALPALLVTLALLISLLSGAAGAAAVTRLPAGAETQTLFVELAGLPLADEGAMPGRGPAAIVAEQRQFRAAARAAGIRMQEQYSYSTLFNGLSVTIAVRDLPALARLPGVQNLYPVVRYELPELAASTQMIGAPTALDLGYDGTGVRVAVIDTGIDYTHPDLGACFGAGCRVALGHDFVGDGYTGPGSPVVPDDDPMDLHGHGTHVAGIIGAGAAGPEGVTGVAPGVTFLAYKVFGPSGPTGADVILAALERALADGADVVNMSIGSSFQWPDYPTARAADRLVRRGVVVSASAGNSGAAGLFATSAPSVGSRVMAVASFDNQMLTLERADLSDGSAAGYAPLTFSPHPAGLTLEVVAVPNLGNLDADYDGLAVHGKAVLVSRGAETFASKVARAMRFGAAAVLIHNNQPGIFFGTLGTATNGGEAWIPAVSLTQADGARLRSMAGASVSFTDAPIRLPNPTGGQVSAFSSWGPSPDLTLKPDLGAPGGMIYSTYPVAMGGYASLSGTSMAAPHAAGAAALILQAQPRLRGHMVQDLLVSTADPRPLGTTPYLWPTNRQGAGLINVAAALQSPVRVSPARLSLGALPGGASAGVSLTLANGSDAPVTYAVGHRSALANQASPPNSPSVSLYLAGAAFASAAETITVPALGGATLTAQIAAPVPGPDGLLFGGYLTLTDTAGKAPTLVVPYGGYAGDYQAAGTLHFNPYGLPWLASLEPDGYYYQRESLTLNPASGETAYVLINLARQAQRLRLGARAVSGRNAGRIYDLSHLPRSGDPSAFFALTWDGRDRRGRPVLPGDYVLQLEVLRPLGDERNPEHWDRWESGLIRVTGG